MCAFVCFVHSSPRRCVTSRICLLSATRIRTSFTSRADMPLTLAFLMTYRIYCTPTQFFQLLMKRYRLHLPFTYLPFLFSFSLCCTTRQLGSSLFFMFFICYRYTSILFWHLMLVASISRLRRIALRNKWTSGSRKSFIPSAYGISLSSALYISPLISLLYSLPYFVFSILSISLFLFLFIFLFLFV